MSKLGVQVVARGEWDRIIAAQPRVMVVLDDLEGLKSLHEALEDRCLLVAGTTRLGTDWEAFWHGPAERSLDRALDRWWEAAAPLVEAAPFAFWMSFQGVHDRHDAAAFAAFETARAERLAAEGVRACVGNIATGLPDPHDLAWADFLTTCRAVRRHGGVLGLQEFGALYMWTGYGPNQWRGSGFRLERKFPADYQVDAALCLHYRELYRDMLEPVGLGDLPLVITSCGLGPVADDITAALSVDGRPTAGWRSCIQTWRRRDGEHDPEDFYLRQLQWYDAQIARDPFVIGAAVYGWGTGDSSEIAGRMGSRLLEHIAAGSEPTAPLHPQVIGQGIVSAPPQDVVPSASRRTGKQYYISVGHPEIFDALWRQGEQAAGQVGAFLTWREVRGMFVLQMDDFNIWRELYQYGQFLAQQLGVELDGGEIDGSSLGEDS